MEADKNTRYDRQLRLWGDHGQAALGKAQVCLLHATATGTEVLKNLVLPGIAGFTVVDGARVGPSDLGTNFFLTRKSLGLSRAQCCVQLLQKLNNVRGEAIEEEIEGVLDSNPTFFARFTLVVATSLPEATLLRVSKILWASSIPLVVVRSYGFLGFIRVAVPSHQIVESHPDNFQEDLRLECPFPGLRDFMDSLDLDKMTNSEHGNVPYLVVLYKYLQQWRADHNGTIPQKYKDKVALKDRIRSGVRCDDEGIPLDEENFEEALQNVNRSVFEYQIPSCVRKILECSNGSAEDGKFWLLVRALKEFVMSEGDGRLLPLRGSIPDMTSNSKMYVDLCRVYQAKAKEDLEAFKSHLSQVLLSVGKPANYISEEEIRLFCCSSHFLRDLRYRSIEDELETPDPVTLSANLENSESEVVYYVLLRAAERFFEMYHFYPGDGTEGIETDSVKLRSIAVSLLQKWHVSGGEIDADQVTEFCRYGASKLHSVAAFVGGVAAQEVIKLITRQFVPLNNTWIYNAATSTSVTVAL